MIDIKDLSYSFDQKMIFSHLNLHVPERQILSIMGASGRGKTTLLKIISGLIRPDQGELFHAGKKIERPSRNRVIIFQDHLLFPWMTVKENIEFVLKAQGKDLKEVSHYLSMVKLEETEELYPHQLSGGMKQRVGIARALASEPQVLLLDEPFASIDPIIRNEIIFEIKKLVKNLNLTVVFVTHNIEEAIYFSDRVVVLGDHNSPVAEDVKINIQRPDSLIELKKHPQYFEYEHLIYHQLKKGIL